MPRQSRIHHVWIKICSIGPLDSAEFSVYHDSCEYNLVTKWRKYADELGCCRNINFTADAIFKTNEQFVCGSHGNFNNIFQHGYSSGCIAFNGCIERASCQSSINSD